MQLLFQPHFLREHMKSLLQNSISTASRATYDSGTRAFLKFATLYNRIHPDGSPIPASEEMLMLLAAYLTFNLKPQSIEVYLYGVRNRHLENGYANPLQDCLQLQRLLWGIKPTYTTKLNQQLPVTPSLLRSFYSLLNQHYHDHYMLWAAMLLAFGELVTLTHHDLVDQQMGTRYKSQHPRRILSEKEKPSS